jgi:hypothetical protein
VLRYSQSPLRGARVIPKKTPVEMSAEVLRYYQPTPVFDLVEPVFAPAGQPEGSPAPSVLSFTHIFRITRETVFAPEGQKPAQPNRKPV